MSISVNSLRIVEIYVVSPKGVYVSCRIVPHERVHIQSTLLGKRVAADTHAQRGFVAESHSPKAHGGDARHTRGAGGPFVAWVYCHKTFIS